MTEQREVPRRDPLSRDRVLRAAVRLADQDGVDTLSMRNLAQQLGVVPMALYKHVTGKEELLDGMVEVIVGEIDLPALERDWKDAVRQRILSARRALLAHGWASEVIESRTVATPVVLDYLESLMGMFRSGGLSVDLTHHAMHALGPRMWGLTRDVFPTPAAPADPAAQQAAFGELAARYPHLLEMATAGDGQGCDAEREFELALDVLLDGFERLHQQGWSPAGARRSPDAADGAGTMPR
jgi:AcrR family transcriptional regulator